MKKILVAYTTNSGSTEDVARAIQEVLVKKSNEVDVLRLEEATSIETYNLVIVGAPMILGWHREAVKFVKKHQQELGKIPAAYFFTAMRLTHTGEEHINSTPIYLDPGLAKPPLKAGRLSLKERYATPANYLRPVLKAAPQVKPVSVAFFGGKLELFRLRFLQMLFVLLVIRAQPGDLRNWAFIQEWADSLS